MSDKTTNETTADGFAALGLTDPVQAAIDALGYETPSPIQARAIPPVLAGRDLLGVAQTGTGKTAAFALPLLSRIDLELAAPQVLVLTPTRELAIQVAEAFRRYASKMTGFHVAPIYGGQEYSGQLRALQRGVHVVVGTPGRVTDHVKRGSLRLDTLSTVVLDEADEMLRMGFLDEVEWILGETPDDRQTALFSATMSAPIRRVAHTYLKDPVEVRIQAETVTVSDTEQLACLVHPADKLDALTRLLETAEFDGMLIFVRTRNATVELADRLEARGFACDALSGEMTQQARERTVNRLRKGAVDILVATDVAARGIDVSRISHVINFDIPYDIEAYIHRVGRTGRAGRRGTAITFATQREGRLLRAIERATRSPIERLELPGTQQVSEKRIAAFKLQMKEILDGDQKLDFFRDLIRDFASEHDCSTEDAAAALTYLLQRERPLQPAADTLRRPRPMHDRHAGKDRRDDPRRPQGSKRPTRGSKPVRGGEQVEFDRYRIQVGREHGVNPGHIVGAIANEAGLDSTHIGRINLYGTTSTVELPKGMPPELLRHLQKVRIFQRPLGMRRDDGPDGDDRPGGAPPRRRDAKPKGRPATLKPKGRRAPASGPKKSTSGTRDRFAAAKKLVAEADAPPLRKSAKKAADRAGKARRLAARMGRRSAGPQKR